MSNKKPTYQELEAEVARLTVVNNNLWRAARESAVSSRNNDLDRQEEAFARGQYFYLLMEPYRFLSRGFLQKDLLHTRVAWSNEMEARRRTEKELKFLRELTNADKIFPNGWMHPTFLTIDDDDDLCIEFIRGNTNGREERLCFSTNGAEPMCSIHTYQDGQDYKEGREAPLFLAKVLDKWMNEGKISK